MSGPARVRQRRRRPSNSPAGIRRGYTLSLAQISRMVSEDRLDTDTYGVSELRDGFFDATFVRPREPAAAGLRRRSRDPLPAELDAASPFSPRRFLGQWRELRSHVRRVATTRAGIRLLQSFVAFAAPYGLCLVPAVRRWLGRHHYIMVFSVIINHPGRPLGAQVDGALLTILGTAAGLGWGVLGLLLSTSTSAADAGYGGILALFLALLMALVAFVRSFFIRFYQAVLCAGVAAAFTVLVQTNRYDVEWSKLLDYSIPWLLGQAIALVVNCLVFPDAGAWDLAATLHASFAVMQEALVHGPRDGGLRRRLGRAFVDLSQALRDMTIDMTITRFQPDDVRELRNLMQAVIRTLLPLKMETYLFEDAGSGGGVMVAVDGPGPGAFETLGGAESAAADEDGSRKHVRELRGSADRVLSCMAEGLRRGDAALMGLSGHRRHLGPPPDVSSDIAPVLAQIKQAQAAFDAVESTLLDTGELPASSMRDSGVVQLLVFARHVREAAAVVERLMAKIEAMQCSPAWPRLRLPSYPFRKALYRTNAQVRHDRGGATAGHYHIAFAEIARLLDKIKSIEHKPMARGEDGDAAGPVATCKRDRLRYKAWRILYRLQGFESRFAFKVCLVTGLLSVPGYLDRTKGWWDRYECWWAVAVSWIVMHPRVGGNLQDLFVRALLALLGAAWAGAAYVAGNGHPGVMAAFAAVYMLPMLYRFTRSSHPRSGLVGCLSFAVVSLGLYGDVGDASPARLAMLRGVPFAVGTTVPIVVNWVLWPFVARHELRHALSSMLFFMSVIYRSVVSRYVYFLEGRDPTPRDVQRSEMLEGRIREGFVRIRQLVLLTQKEMRLRAPFDARPYVALADACEGFFEHLVAVRQSALFYNPGYIHDNPVAAAQLLGARRDAVASILGNLYVLAGALRSQRKVPRYLPSAAAARKRLLVKTAEVDAHMLQHAPGSDAKWHRKWSAIYRYSYNESLTGCVAQLNELERYTKLIVGEQGFDLGDEPVEPVECDG